MWRHGVLRFERDSHRAWAQRVHRVGRQGHRKSSIEATVWRRVTEPILYPFSSCRPPLRHGLASIKTCILWNPPASTRYRYVECVDSTEARLIEAVVRRDGLVL